MQINISINNKLHQHIWLTHDKTKAKIRKFSSIITSINLKLKTTLMFIIQTMMINADVYAVNIVESDTINLIKKSDCDFHNWHYITIIFQFSASAEDFTEFVCLNTEYIMSLINREFLQKHLSNCFIQKTKSRITVQDIDSWTHEC